MSELAEALVAAQSTSAMGAALAAHAAREIGLSGFSFLRASGPVLTPDDVFALSAREAGRPLRERILGILPSIDRELQPFDRFWGLQRKSFDVADRWPKEVVLRSETYNGLWRPISVEQQLVGSIGTTAQPIGFCCVARARGEGPFTARDLEAFERMRLTAERALEGYAALGTDRLEETLAVLARAEPAPWFLFDPAGDLLWLTDEAAGRLALDVARVGSAMAIRHSGALERLRGWVRARARRYADGLEAAPPAIGLEAPGERATLRRFETRPGRSLFLVGFARPRGTTPARSEVECRERATQIARAERLTARQAEVLALLAAGHANKAIAARLGCGESNVEFHVSRLLAALHCESRTQLVARFWTAP